MGDSGAQGGRVGGCLTGVVYGDLRVGLAVCRHTHGLRGVRSIRVRSIRVRSIRVRSIRVRSVRVRSVRVRSIRVRQLRSDAAGAATGARCRPRRGAAPGWAVPINPSNSIQMHQQARERGQGQSSASTEGSLRGTPQPRLTPAPRLTPPPQITPPPQAGAHSGAPASDICL